MSWINQKNRYGRTLLFLLAFALGVRLAYVITLEKKVFWVDEVEYLQLSQKIVAGSGYVDQEGAATAFRPLGYPLFLAALRIAGIGSITAVRIVQSVVGTITVYLIYLLTAYLYTKKAALFAALFYSIYPYFIFLPGTILASTWFSFVLVLASYLFIKGLNVENKVLMSAGGALLGYASLIRPSALLLILPVIVWLMMNTFDRRKALSTAAIIVVAFAAVTVPWMVRNQYQLGTFTLSTNGGRNLWLGNNELATAQTGSNISPSNEIASQLKLAPSETEKDNIYIRAAKSFIKAHPGKTIRLFFKKAIYFWRWDPSPTTEGYLRQNRWHWWISVLSFGPIFILSLVGFVYSPPTTKRLVSLFLMYAGTFTILHALYFPKVRFRLPIDQFLMVLAGYGLIFLITTVQFSQCEKKRFSQIKLKTKLL